MKSCFSIVHPQGTHVNITEVSCEELDLDSGGIHVKFLTQCVRGDRGWLLHGLVVTLPISYSLDGGTLWGFTRDMRIAD